jgi:hypothetical protein
MREKLGRREMVSLEELLISNIYTQEALINHFEKELYRQEGTV